MRQYHPVAAAALFAIAGIFAPGAAAQDYPVKTTRLIVPYPPGGLDASSEQGSRLRDATVRESAAAAGMIAQASIPLERYPIRPIRLIVPYPPGGGNDVMGRIFAQKLTEAWGQQVIVDNRPGAATTVGTALASRGGKIRALAIARTSRLAEYPNIPTFAEAGLPEYQASAWYSIHAPAGTSRQVIQKLNRELVKAVAMPDMVERLRLLASDGVGNTPEQLDAFVRAEFEKYGKLIRKAGIKVE